MKNNNSNVSKFFAAAAMIGCLGLSETASAREGIGFGIVGEDPSGLTLKLGLSQQTALDLRLGLGFRFDNAFLFQANYLVNIVDFSRNSNFDLPLYVGVGGTLFVFHANNGVDFIGINGRIPIGLDLELRNVPIDFFAEIAPQVALVPGLAVGIDGAAGVRFFF
jgi:hypothetical protein